MQNCFPTYCEAVCILNESERQSLEKRGKKRRGISLERKHGKIFALVLMHWILSGEHLTFNWNENKPYKILNCRPTCYFRIAKPTTSYLGNLYLRHTSQVRHCRESRNQNPSNTPTYMGQLRKDNTRVAKATSGHCFSGRAVTVTLRLENEKVSMINKIPLPRSNAILSGFPTRVSHKVAEAQWLLLLVASLCWVPFIICCSCSASAGMNITGQTEQNSPSAPPICLTVSFHWIHTAGLRMWYRRCCQLFCPFHMPRLQRSCSLALQAILSDLARAL